jgi:sirohydrochlorin cobaltochelatase
MQMIKRGVILVGHGGIPTDCPRELVIRLKRLEGQRREAGGPVSFEEKQLDHRIRHWRRTPQTDPYPAGLEELASTLKSLLNGALFATAYNEYCAPALPEAVQDLVQQGASDITVIRRWLRREAPMLKSRSLNYWRSCVSSMREWCFAMHSHLI